MCPPIFLSIRLFSPEVNVNVSGEEKEKRVPKQEQESQIRVKWGKYMSLWLVNKKHSKFLFQICLKDQRKTDTFCPVAIIDSLCVERLKNEDSCIWAWSMSDRRKPEMRGKKWDEKGRRRNEKRGKFRCKKRWMSRNQRKNTLLKT